MPLLDADPLAMLDARIRLAWTVRASSPRFSDAYWEADDELAWLRMVRDELVRTGHLREEARVLLEAVPVAGEVEAEARAGGRFLRRASARPGRGRRCLTMISMRYHSRPRGGTPDRFRRVFVGP